MENNKQKFYDKHKKLVELHLQARKAGVHDIAEQIIGKIREHEETEPDLVKVRHWLRQNVDTKTSTILRALVLEYENVINDWFGASEHEIIKAYLVSLSEFARFLEQKGD